MQELLGRASLGAHLYAQATKQLSTCGLLDRVQVGMSGLVRRAHRARPASLPMPPPLIEVTSIRGQDPAAPVATPRASEVAMPPSFSVRDLMVLIGQGRLRLDTKLVVIKDDDSAAPAGNDLK